MPLASAPKRWTRHMVMVCLTIGVGNGLTIWALCASWPLGAFQVAFAATISGTLWALASTLFAHHLGVPTTVQPPSADFTTPSITDQPQIHACRLQLTEPRGDLQQLNQSIADISAALEQLTQQVDGTSEIMVLIDRDLVETSGATSAIGQTMEQAGHDLEGLETALDKVHLHAGTGAVEAQQIQSRAEKSLTEIKAVSQQLQATEEHSHSTQATIDSLTGQTEEISTVAEVIRELVADTELLAYNAAIMAAKTGEDGQGFSVIAQEVKELADRTSASAGDIHQILCGIRQDTQAIRSAVDFTSLQIRQGSIASNRAGQAVQQLAELATQTVCRHTEVGQQMVQQSEQVRQLRQEASLGFRSLRSLMQRLNLQKKRGRRLQKTLNRIHFSTADLLQMTEEAGGIGTRVDELLDYHQALLRQPPDAVHKLTVESPAVDAEENLLV